VTPEDATIGSALGARRLELGIDQREAAALIGMSRTTYSSYERNAQRPSVDVFPALAEFLTIGIEELLVLYGATCVASIRPALTRLVAERHGSMLAPISTVDAAADVEARADGFAARDADVPAFREPYVSSDSDIEEPEDYRGVRAISAPTNGRATDVRETVVIKETEDLPLSLTCVPEVQALRTIQQATNSKKKKKRKSKHAKH
jgi:transcriptional regulator with XRE-family HTH domain